MPNIKVNTVPTQLEIARKKKNWSQADLSRISGVSFAKIKEWEQRRNRPSVDTILCIQWALIGVRPLVIEPSIFKSDEEYSEFLNSELFTKFFESFHFIEGQQAEFEKQKSESLYQTLARWRELHKKYHPDKYKSPEKYEQNKLVVSDKNEGNDNEK
jgi:transcriptional regulator with XRE-family HTH domain